MASAANPAAAASIGELQPGEHLAPRADRAGAAHRHDRDAPALRADRFGGVRDERLALGPVVGLGPMHRAAEQLDERDVRRRIRGRSGQDEMDLEAQTRTRRGRETAMAGPAPAGRHDRVGPILDGRGKDELEVPELVVGKG